MPPKNFPWALGRCQSSKQLSEGLSRVSGICVGKSFFQALVATNINVSGIRIVPEVQRGASHGLPSKDCQVMERHALRFIYSDVSGIVCSPFYTILLCMFC